MNEERKGSDKRSDTPAERLFRAIGGADAEIGRASCRERV